MLSAHAADYTGDAALTVLSEQELYPGQGAPGPYELSGWSHKPEAPGAQLSAGGCHPRTRPS